MKRFWVSLLVIGGILGIALTGYLLHQNVVPTYVLRYAENQPLNYPTTQGASILRSLSRNARMGM